MRLSKIFGKGEIIKVQQALTQTIKTSESEGSFCLYFSGLKCIVSCVQKVKLTTGRIIHLLGQLWKAEWQA